MTTAEILRAARAKIDTPDKWVTGLWFKDECYCAGGAIACVATDTPKPCSDQFFADATAGARNALAAHMGDIMHFNDTRTHAEVMAAFDAAIAEAERA